MLEVIEINRERSIAEKCLIIMPIYNRKNFLKQAFFSLRKQAYTHWNLLIVDDGSNDEPLAEIKFLSINMAQRITYVRQENRGPGAARAIGQKFIKNQDFVAFFDSDDFWLEDYLRLAIHQLEKVPELDWVFCPCKRVDYESGETIHESTFFNEISNEPLKFLNLPHSRYEDTFLIDDNQALALIQLQEPIHAGFQNSVVRAEIFKDISIPEYRIGEDRYFLMSAIIKDYRLGYVKKVGVIYNVHQDNLSDTNPNNVDVEKAIWVQRELCRSLTDLEKLTKNIEIISTLRKQVANIQFWLIAYTYYWESGQTQKALSTMFKVIKQYPSNYKFIKTFISSILKALVQKFLNTKRRSL
jgi:glycosyltransferase involved in cell wall biosynthesis